jgi:thiol-disulfide isomerase/thioredoxin
MQLETMRPNPAWTDAGYEDSVATFAALADEIEVHVWGGDWCKDCRAQLPDFGAALAAAGVPDERVHHYPVEKHDDGSKSGEKVDEYGIERIPTVVVQRDGAELARFVEEASVPIVVHLADQLDAAE